MTSPQAIVEEEFPVERRLSDLKREADAIKRLLSQAKFTRIRAELANQRSEIDEVNTALAAVI